MSDQSTGDPFNCPKCGAHDYGLYAPNLIECPHCVKRQRDAAVEALRRIVKRNDKPTGAHGDWAIARQALREIEGVR